ncbi:hypothetical protein [Streptomyces vilmorinianum]|uniref:hypothetical protein n=1 Tax=Streptomyces vilmorinianum TaxID=3051092 RepID=UPI0020C8297D|nr:hypothetical protein [Streptomyces vilmorinianum]
MPAPSATATTPTPAPVPASAPTLAAGSPKPTAGAGRAGSAAGESAGDVVRWAAFCCVLVPVVLVVYGTSLGGAAGTALGLAAVTAVCRVLLRRSEHGLRAEAAGRRGRHGHGHGHGGRKPRRR